MNALYLSLPCTTTAEVCELRWVILLNLNVVFSVFSKAIPKALPEGPLLMLLCSMVLFEDLLISIPLPLAPKAEMLLNEIVVNAVPGLPPKLRDTAAGPDVPNTSMIFWVIVLFSPRLMSPSAEAPRVLIVLFATVLFAALLKSSAL